MSRFGIPTHTAGRTPRAFHRGSSAAVLVHGRSPLRRSSAGRTTDLHGGHAVQYTGLLVKVADPLVAREGRVAASTKVVGSIGCIASVFRCGMHVDSGLRTCGIRRRRHGGGWTASSAWRREAAAGSGHGTATSWCSAWHRSSAWDRSSTWHRPSAHRSPALHRSSAHRSPRAGARISSSRSWSSSSVVSALLSAVVRAKIARAVIVFLDTLVADAIQVVFEVRSAAPRAARHGSGVIHLPTTSSEVVGVGSCYGGDSTIAAGKLVLGHRESPTPESGCFCSYKKATRVAISRSWGVRVASSVSSRELLSQQAPWATRAEGCSSCSPRVGCRKMQGRRRSKGGTQRFRLTSDRQFRQRVVGCRGPG